MDQVMSDFLGIDWTSPTLLPIFVAVSAGLLAKLGVITARNHKAVCIGIAGCVGIGYATYRYCASSMSFDRMIPLLLVYVLTTFAISWLWLYISVYGQFRQGELKPNNKSDVTSS